MDRFIQSLPYNLRIMKDFIAYIIKNIVSKPDDVNIEVNEGEQSTVVDIHVDKEDISKVIGKQGRTIKAIRTIALAVGARYGRKVRIEVIQ
ncbi:MAG: KH domain-containing protein [Candidatus Algichlamydia australiensis]|nr:KH domain-containing protein [Chlamydiales bacterium]